jgi:hypothetical protein
MRPYDRVLLGTPAASGAPEGAVAASAALGSACSTCACLPQAAVMVRRQTSQPLEQLPGGPLQPEWASLAPSQSALTHALRGTVQRDAAPSPKTALNRDPMRTSNPHALIGGQASQHQTVMSTVVLTNDLCNIAPQTSWLRMQLPGALSQPGRAALAPCQQL